MDRSKADAFTKAFALIQSGWLITQSIARAARGLAITELELATMEGQGNSIKQLQPLSNSTDSG